MGDIPFLRIQPGPYLVKGESRATQVDDLKRQIADWEAQCLRLRDQLGVIPGYKGFDAET